MKTPTQPPPEPSGHESVLDAASCSTFNMLGFEQSIKAKISRLKAELKSLDKILIGDFEAQYGSYSASEARSRIRGQIAAYKCTLGDSKKFQSNSLDKLRRKI